MTLIDAQACNIDFTVCTMDYPKFIVSDQKEEFINIQRLMIAYFQDEESDWDSTKHSETESRHSAVSTPRDPVRIQETVEVIDGDDDSSEVYLRNEFNFGMFMES